MKKLLITAACFLFLHEAPAQSVALANKPSKTTSRKPVAEGASVWGVFHGRVPCQATAKMMAIGVEANCEVLKWAFTFNHDPQTGKPTTYQWDGSLYREQPRTGKWALVRGTADDPHATVIQLDPDQPEKTVYLLKGDENVLFILDRSKKPMVGGDYLSYTFNRVIN
ncbi:MAG: hypothetical protein ACO1N1_08495 [Dyadobacter fermentans]